jgi:organic hydroperoxide reductase OsmC/OhrA
MHHYRVALRWTGNTGRGTAAYHGNSRAHEISAGDKPPIAGSSDPSFRGDPARWNPEELLLASLSGCHQLWYLSLCAQHGVVVIGYEDTPEGWMEEHADGAGHFVRAVLRPRVTLAPNSDTARARALHAVAHDKCFIARSVRFPVEVAPEEHRAGSERAIG